MAMKVRNMSKTDWVILIGSWTIVFGLIAFVLGQFVLKKTGWPPL